MSVLRLKDRITGRFVPVVAIKGETGDAAGFGTVEASVDANYGIPSVEVTTSGEDTAKNFSFAFHNLKQAPYNDSEVRGLIAVERARIDSFTRLAEGSTTGDAELIDSRIGADGVVYTTAGEAVRKQLSKIKQNFDVVETINPTNWLDYSTVTFGKYCTNTGSIADNPSYWYTDYIPVSEGDVITRQWGSNQIVSTRWISCYDANKSVMASAGSDAFLEQFTVPAGVAYIRMSDTPYMANGENAAQVVKSANVTPFTRYFEPYNIYDLNDNVRVRTDNLDNVIDESLTQTGKAADSKVVGDYVADVSTYVEPKNIFDGEWISGEYVSNTTGNTDSNALYQRTDYIEINGGIVASTMQDLSENGGTRYALYDENKAYISGELINTLSYDSATQKQYFTAYDADAKYIRLSIWKDMGAQFQIEYGSAPTAYEAHFAPHWEINDSALANLDGNVDVNLDNLTFASWGNLFDVSDAENADGYYLNTSGGLAANATYFTTAFIKVKPNTDYAFYVDAYNDSARFVCEYDADKTFIPSTNKSYVSTIRTSALTEYIRVTIYHSSYSESTVVEGTSPQSGVSHELHIPVKYVKGVVNSIHAYLPKDIYVAVGRTVELYNELVCLEASKYHIDWNCSVGVDYARKFSITGTANNIGTYTLTLNIYDDNLVSVFTANATVHIVANGIASTKKVVPIGDSLTNQKPWSDEVQTLSNEKISFIGTRQGAYGAYKHEGRSGATAGWYNADSEYTYDHNYVGAPEVDGESNPFWDGSKFSLDHYITTQSEYIGTPDAVQILLGTNGIALDPTANMTNIKTIVDSIVSEYPTMPIFVCNTIYRSNQDGYYSTGSDGYAAASDFQFSADMKIMNLQNALAEAFEDYSTVTIVPLSVCMDRENDFGQVEVPVNPRLANKTVFIPNESVHPQLAGYQQMADVIYSAYCAVLS